MRSLQNPGISLDVFARMFDFAVFLHLSRCPLAAAAESVGKQRELERIQEQVRVGIPFPDGFREDPADRLGAVFAQLFHRPHTNRPR